MEDAIAGRILVLIIGTAISILFVRELSWEDKFERFLLRTFTVLFFLRGIAVIIFDWIGLFSLD